MNVVQLKTKIIKDWGKRCKKFSSLCPNCQVWHAMDILEDLYELRGHIKAIKP